jgi:hypothetical protein
MAKKGVFLMHDPTLVRWQYENIFKFPDTHLLVETIKTAAGKYQTAIFESDDLGRVRQLAILYSKYYLNEEDALIGHNQLVKDFNNLQNNGVFLNINEVYQEIEKNNLIPQHDGPKIFNFIRVPAGNAAIGYREAK